MPVEEHPLYADWMTKVTRADQTRKFYEDVRKRRGENDPITKHAKSKMEEAEKEYSALIEKL